jgi:hypothetical protein
MWFLLLLGLCSDRADRLSSEDGAPAHLGLVDTVSLTHRPLDGGVALETGLRFEEAIPFAEGVVQLRYRCDAAPRGA